MNEEATHAFVEQYHQKLQENFEAGLRHLGVSPEEKDRIANHAEARRVSEDPLEADFFFDGKPFLSVRRAKSKDTELRYKFERLGGK